VSRTCTGRLSVSQLLRTVRNVSSDEVMVFLFAKDYGVRSARLMAKDLGFHYRPGWFQLLESNSSRLQT
jgi:hypothetical protein